MKTKMLWTLAMALGLVLWGCGSQPAAPRPVEREGVVFVDPNRVTAAPEATAAPVTVETAAAPTAATPEPAEATATEPEGEAAPAPELYFESKGVRMEPWMEAAPVLSALGDPIGSFEADSCAYIGKDLFYWYPGFELTVNEVEGVNRITAITVADDTVTIPQGLRIYDDEEKLLDILGGTEANGLYTYQNGQTLLLIQVKEAEGDRRIASMEYRVAADQ